MKLSEGVEWGVHCAVVLAGLAPGATLPGKALAEYHGVSESYLLARPPERITLLDVVQAIDGTQPAFRCTEIRQRGPLALDARAYRRPCVINAAMLRAESAWRTELERTSLADIVSGVVAAADPRVTARSAGWLECNGRPAQRD